MPIKHGFESARPDNDDSGDVQPSHWNADHALSGFLALLDTLNATPSTVVTLDAAGNAVLVARSTFVQVDSPAFTGTPQAPTPAKGTNNTQIATTSYIDRLVGAVNGVASLDGSGKVPVAQLPAGTANGVAALDGGGKVPLAQLPSSIAGGLNYQGAWNASTNSPALASGVGTKGFYYKVSVAGSTAIDGLSQWNQGDLIAFNGATWDKIDGIASEVTSVAGRTGAVTLSASDVNGAQGLGFLINAAIAGSVASNALSISLTNPAGGAPSAGNPVSVRFPAAGTFSDVAITSALSIVVPSGTTLGHTSGRTCPLYVYGIKNGAAVELALSAKYFGKYGTVTTAAIAAGATSTTMYSTTARSAVPFVLLGVAYSNQTAAGTWAAAPSSIEAGSHINLKTYAFNVNNNGVNGTTGGLTASSATKAGGLSATGGYDVDGIWDATNSRFVCVEPGVYSFAWSWGTNEGMTGLAFGAINKNAGRLASGASVYMGGSNSPICYTLAEVTLVPGDVIEFYCIQNSGSNLTLYGNPVATFAVGKMIRAPI